MLDRVSRNYNIGAIFRLCDAFLVGRLIICGKELDLNKRKLMQAARGTERWVPWNRAETALPVIQQAKTSGTSVSQEIVDIADVVVSIPEAPCPPHCHYRACPRNPW